MIDHLRQTTESREQYVENRRAKRRAECALERLADPHDGRYVYAVLPRCPACGGAKHKSYRSIEQQDGSRMKWTRCECGEKFIIILE
ncbi:MAG: hypothetical protein WD738_23905 [Pirellulales bacterium]